MIPYRFTTRLFALLALAGAGLYPQLLSCAEARPADVAIPAAARPQARLVPTLELELPYGEAPETLGFLPPGPEREAMGPNAIEVRPDGTVLLSDPVRRKIFALVVDGAGRPTLSVAGPLPPRPRAVSGQVPAAVRVVKTSAEDGEVIFADGAGELRVGLSAGGPLASLALIGVDARGRAFVVVERFCRLGETAVDREIVVVDSAGALVARRALPEPPLVRPLTELYLTADGVLWRLASGPEAVRVERLEVLP